MDATLPCNVEKLPFPQELCCYTTQLILIDLPICVAMVIMPFGLSFLLVYSQVEWASTVTLLTMPYPFVAGIRL
ncbi:hypothetical protein Ddc_15983 [Ditylenchus destructor]|nr:hypothetical protein Ddc_15983 [Ditylenchus destructor]